MYYYRNLLTLSEAFLLHIISWVAQILSHKYLEGRAPALMDSLSQAFLEAPVFSLEYMFPGLLTK